MLEVDKFAKRVLARIEMQARTATCNKCLEAYVYAGLIVKEELKAYKEKEPLIIKDKTNVQQPN